MPYTLMVPQRANAAGEGTGTSSCRRDVSRWRDRSGGMLDAHGIVRDVFVEIREDQQ